jgi:hypothetical protein
MALFRISTIKLADQVCGANEIPTQVPKEKKSISFQIWAKNVASRFHPTRVQCVNSDGDDVHGNLRRGSLRTVHWSPEPNGRNNNVACEKKSGLPRT